MSSVTLGNLSSSFTSCIWSLIARGRSIWMQKWASKPLHLFERPPDLKCCNSFANWRYVSKGFVSDKLCELLKGFSLRRYFWKAIVAEALRLVFACPTYMLESSRVTSSAGSRHDHWFWVWSRHSASSAMTTCCGTLHCKSWRCFQNCKTLHAECTNLRLTLVVQNNIDSKNVRPSSRKNELATTHHSQFPPGEAAKMVRTPEVIAWSKYACKLEASEG